MAGKTPAMLIGFGSAMPKSKSEDEESDDAMAGQALIDAVRSGDGQAVEDAIETLLRKFDSKEEPIDEGDDEL